MCGGGAAEENLFVVSQASNIPYILKWPKLLFIYLKKTHSGIQFLTYGSGDTVMYLWDCMSEFNSQKFYIKNWGTLKIMFWLLTLKWQCCESVFTLCLAQLKNNDGEDQPQEVCGIFPNSSQAKLTPCYLGNNEAYQVIT